VNNASAWIAIGFLGQLAFSARFVLQWIASERARRSVVPKAFWYCSLAGSCILLAYAIHRSDPVFIAGQAGGLAIYLRNLRLIAVERSETQQEAPSPHAITPDA